MRKLPSTYLVILIAISIVALLVFQYMIILRSIKQAKNQFNLAASKSLVESAKQIDATTPMLFKNPPKLISDIDYVSIEVRGDSAKLFYHQFNNKDEVVIGVATQEIQEIVSPDLDTIVSQKIESNFKPIKYYYKGKAKLRQYEFLSLMEIKQSFVTEKLKSIFNASLFKKEIRIKLLEKDLNLCYLDSMVKKHLLINGIKTEYAFTIKDKKQTYVSYNSKTNAPTQTTELNFPLFMQKGFPDDLRVYVFFEQNTGYIFNSILEVIVLSLAITLILLLTLTYLARSFNTQKRIAEFKSDFLRKMSHDFKTPIATIGLAADSITSKQLINNPSQIHLFGGIIKEEIKRLHILLEKILEASIIQKGELKANLTTVDIHNQIQGIIQNIEIIVLEKGGQIKLHCPHKDVYAQIDKTLFIHIINNLVDNALKYNKNVPEIRIEVEKLKSTVQIKIHDNGIGIPENEKNKIFEKLYRIENQETQNIEGTGLGLFFVKKSMELMKGKIHLKSKENKGSIFILTFPLVQNNITDDK